MNRKEERSTEDRMPLLQTETGRTKHEELTQTLRELVTTLSPGSRLPSQTELMRRFGVSDRTVLRSLEDLRRDGWIIRRRGSGTFVADRVRTAVDAIRTEAPGPTIGVLAVTPSPSPFYQRCLEYLTPVVENAGCALICHHAGREPEGADTLAIESLQPRGFVAFNYALYPLARRLRERGHRVVILGSPPVDVHPDVPCVYSDHDQGGFAATDHLLELGHRRLAYVRLAQTWSVPLEKSLRWRGHLRALDAARERGRRVSCELIQIDLFQQWRDEPERVREYFRGPDAPTALVCWNDSEAAQVLSLLHHAGLRVPDDLSLVGYDALPIGLQTLPPLTTVDQHLGSQLRAVMGLLMRDEAPHPGQSVVVVPTLVARASSGPPAGV